jgi:FHS family Na+ dependent glucose MFS transporter 1
VFFFFSSFFFFFPKDIPLEQHRGSEKGVPEPEPEEPKEHESKYAVWGKTLTYFYLFFVIGLVQGVIGVSLTVLRKHAHTTEAWIGTLVLARGVGWLVGSMSGGWLFAQWDAHRLLIAACMVMVLSHIAVPLLDFLWGLLGVFLVIGIAGGVLETGGNTVLIWQWKTEVQPYLQFLNFAIGVGAFASPLITAAFLLEESVSFSVTASYFCLAFLCALPIVFLSVFRAPRAGLATEEGNEDPKDHPQQVWGIIISMSLFCFFISGIEISTGSWVSVYCKDRFKVTDLQSDLALSVFYFGFTVARLVFVFMPQILSNLAQMGYLLFLLSVGVICMFLASISLAIKLFFASVFVMGFGLGPLFAVGLSLPILSAAQYLLSSKDVAFVVASSNVGELLTPALLSMTWDSVGPEAYIYVCILMTVLTAISAAVLIRFSRKKRSLLLPTTTTVLT